MHPFVIAFSRGPDTPVDETPSCMRVEAADMVFLLEDLPKNESFLGFMPRSVLNSAKIPSVTLWKYIRVSPLLAMFNPI